MATESRRRLEARKIRIGDDFDRIARGYDALNALNPGYARHLEWSAERMQLEGPARILDLCCGTGTSTKALLDAYPGAAITGVDLSAGMLRAARAKPDLRGVTFIQGDAMDPASVGATGPFDGILMAYGIRNVPDPELCLRRLWELLDDGGILCLHEYSVTGSRRSRIVWQLVTAGIVIPLGLIITRSTSIFRYLRRSVLEFDSVGALEDRLRRSGFVDVRTEPMDGWQSGILHSFLARKT